MSGASSRLAAILALVLATLGCAPATKRAAAAALKGEPARSFLGGAVRLQYAENSGAFLGLFCHCESAYGVRSALLKIVKKLRGHFRMK